MSTLSVSNITDGTTTVGTSYVVNGSAKAWVNFNGTGTIAARDSVNVASLTDNGTGLYTVSFTNNMTGDSYSVSGHSAGGGATWDFWMGGTNGYPTASSVGVEAGYGASTSADANYVFCNIHGDLA